MSLEHVAALAERVANDSAARAALRDDPAQMRKPLRLSEAQVRALISASSFSTARPVVTTSAEGGLLATTGDALLGTLLPPEGSGFPSTSELPPQTGGITPAPAHGTPHAAPHHAGPISPNVRPTPQHGAPTATPGAPTRGSGPTVPQGSMPQTPASQAPATGGTASGMTPAGSGTGGAVATQGSPACNGPVSTGTLSGNGAVEVGQEGVTHGAEAAQDGSVTVGVVRGKRLTACRCSCDVAMTALVGQVSATAQTTLTGITAIASLNC